MTDIETILGTFFLENPDATEEDIREFYATRELTRMITHEAQELEQVIAARKKLRIQLDRPLIPQRSEEWYNLRENLLTASDVAQAVGKGKYGNREALLQKKAFPSREFAAANLAPLVWGVRYEPVAAMCYQRMKGNIPLHEFGLIPHSTCKVFGASPDGITDLGVMLEIKCPYKRKIIQGDVPEHYALQIQGQLEVCDLEYCDYIECVLKQHTRDTFEDIQLREGQHAGIIAECYGKGDTYIYSPPELYTIEELLKWEHEQYQNMPDMIMTFHRWTLDDFNLIRIKRDRELFARLRPQIEGFWADVLKAREAGPLPPPASTRKRIRAVDIEPAFAFVDEPEQEDPKPAEEFAFISEDGE